MEPTRRKFLTRVSTGGVIAVAGCIDGVIVDTDHGCEVNEPDEIPDVSRPVIGSADASVEIKITQDLSERPWIQFMEHSLKDIIEEYVETGVAKIEFYDLPLRSNSRWATELGSVGRYIHTVEGEETYTDFLFAINEAHINDGNIWQAVGDFADENGLDACTTIAHGSWKSYEEEIWEDRSEMRDQGLTQVPAIVVDGSEVSGFGSVENAYGPMSEAIEDADDSGTTVTDTSE